MHVLVFKPSVSGRAGGMHDPVDVLGVLYESLKIAAGQEAPINAAFSFNVVESVTCRACGMTSHMQDNSPVRNPLYIAISLHQSPSYIDRVGIHLLPQYTAS